MTNLKQITFNWPEDWIAAYENEAGLAGLPLDSWITINLREKLSPAIVHSLSYPDGRPRNNPIPNLISETPPHLAPIFSHLQTGRTSCSTPNQSNQAPVFNVSKLASYFRECQADKQFRIGLDGDIVAIPNSLKDASEDCHREYIKHRKAAIQDGTYE